MGEKEATLLRLPTPKKMYKLTKLVAHSAMNIMIVWSTLGLIFVATFIIHRHLKKKKRPPLPPGPPADPLIGHLRLMPDSGQNQFFYELGLKYGPVVHLNVLGKSFIILNSVQAASDLFDKRGAIYAGRPAFPIYDLIGLGDGLVFADYGDNFRTQRRMIQNYVGKNQHSKHRPIQLREARLLTQGLLDQPEDIHSLFIRFATAIIVDIDYGHQIHTNDDPFVEIAEKCEQFAVDSGPLGSTPVDLFPFLRFFPSWFPGTYYATFARQNRYKFDQLQDYPLEQVKKHLAQGVAKPSFLATQLEQLRLDGNDNAANIDLLKLASAILYIGAAGTTSSTVSFFVLAMVLFPECQAAAQEELDRVVGRDRLPEFGDREELIYLECLMWEMFRWNQATPTGGPRKVLEDDIYEGMFIPKGSTIIPNVKGMSLDDNVYKDPSKFDPTRFLPPSLGGRSEPYPVVFGWGRRICPGRHLGEDSTWIAMATILSTMNILKEVGADGVEIVPSDIPISVGITSHPTPYKCRFEPRSKGALRLLRQAIESV